MDTETETETVDTSPDATVLASIDDIAAEFSAMDTGDEAPDAPQPAEGATDETPTTEETVLETAPVVEEVVEEKADPAVEKGFERLVEREVAVRARESEISALQSKLAEAEKRLAAFPADAVAELGVTPGKTLRALGHDPEQVVRLYLAEKLQAEGKEVPEKLQVAIEKAQTAAELRSLRMEQQRYQQQMAAQAFVAQVESGAQSYVSKGDIKNAPTVASVAKANPGRVYAEIMDEISRDATSPGKDPQAPLISYEEAAARVEKRWADLRSLFGPAPGASTPAAPPLSTKAAPTKSVTVAPKPLTKPQPAWKTERDLLDAIVRETEAEFRKAAKPV